MKVHKILITFESYTLSHKRYSVNRQFTAFCDADISNVVFELFSRVEISEYTVPDLSTRSPIAIN